MGSQNGSSVLDRSLLVSKELQVAVIGFERRGDDGGADCGAARLRSAVGGKHVRQASCG